MKLKDIIMGFLGGYGLGLVFTILFLLIKSFFTWDWGIYNFDFIWKTWYLARSLIIAGIIGIFFVWGIKYENQITKIEVDIV